MPDEDKAAAKIQAGFRGHKVRKDMKGENAEKTSPTRTGVDKQSSDLETGETGGSEEIVKDKE